MFLELTPKVIQIYIYIYAVCLKRGTDSNKRNKEKEMTKKFEKDEFYYSFKK